MTLNFQTSYITVFCVLYFLLLTTNTLVAKPIAQNIVDVKIDAESYLQVSGYLEEARTTKQTSLSIYSSHKNNSLQSAIESFQRFMGLNVTRIVDDATKRHMARPRCGVKDILNSLEQNQTLDNYPNSSLWNKSLRTYRFGSFASYEQISRPMQELILNDAFYEWSKYVPITFEKVCETCSADIVIEFIDDELGKHHDYDKKTSFERNEMAHATFPWLIYPAHIHFNKKVIFTTDYNSTSSYKNLFHIAVHEIGHILGLNHVKVNEKSVMYAIYPEPYNNSRQDYLTTIDQELIQKVYGKRKKSIISSCSTWSSHSQSLNITITDWKESQNLRKKIAENRVENEINHQLLVHFLSEHRQWYRNVSQLFHEEKNISSSLRANQTRIGTYSTLQTNHFKSSGGVIENVFGQTEIIFIDRFDNLYLSDYLNNRVLKYDAIATKQQKTIVAENLNTPRGLYVTNDSNLLYVVDSKGVHRFKLNETKTNIGASSLLFCLDSSSEIYNIIVDEDDFNTIYLYDTAHQRIQRCPHLPHGWQCETIVPLTHETNYSGIKYGAWMVFDAWGDISLMDSTSNVVFRYKHVSNSCQPVPTSIKLPSSLTISATSLTTETNTTINQSLRKNEPVYTSINLISSSTILPKPSTAKTNIIINQNVRNNAVLVNTQSLTTTSTTIILVQKVNIFPNGDKYEGQLKDNKMHGRGTYYFVNGNKYVGEWVNDMRTGYGVFTWYHGAKYEGQFKDDQMHGRGTYYSVNGNKYVGEWVNDMRTGYGVFTWYHGAKYEGQFKDDQMHGRGTYYSVSGNKYVGEWVNDKKTGQGVFSWANGDKYEGQYKDDKKHGYGTAYFANGNKYVGDWVNDSETGQGVFSWYDGDKYEGQYKDSKRHGHGTYYFANGEKYVGDWVNDQKIGQGVFSWPSGNKYEGQFKYDKMHGRGKMRYSNGTTKQGVWINGVFAN